MFFYILFLSQPIDFCYFFFTGDLNSLKIGTVCENDIKSGHRDSDVQIGTVPRKSGQLACLEK